MSTKAQVKTQAKTPAAPAVARIVQPPVGVLGREAERPDIAAQLEAAARLGHSLGAVGVASAAPPTIQRQEIPEGEEEELQMKQEPAALQRQELPEEEEEELQTKPANGVQRQGGGEGFQLGDETASRINRARGGGQPLEGGIQKQMGETMGHDFSSVRVHTDSEADALNQQLQAKAFTTGPDIFFRRGEYNPDSSGSRELIAHELTHVVQQGTGRVLGGGSSSGMTVRPAGDAFEQEAQAMAAQAARASRKDSRRRAAVNPALSSPADILAVQRLLVKSEGEGKPSGEERDAGRPNSPIASQLEQPLQMSLPRGETTVRLECQAEHLQGIAFRPGGNVGNEVDGSTWRFGQFPASGVSVGAIPSRRGPQPVVQRNDYEEYPVRLFVPQEGTMDLDYRATDELDPPGTILWTEGLTPCFGVAVVGTTEVALAHISALGEQPRTELEFGRMKERYIEHTRSIVRRMVNRVEERGHVRFVMVTPGTDHREHGGIYAPVSWGLGAEEEAIRDIEMRFSATRTAIGDKMQVMKPVPAS
jgi:hypothetical protein